MQINVTIFKLKKRAPIVQPSIPPARSPASPTPVTLCQPTHLKSYTDHEPFKHYPNTHYVTV